MSTSFVWPAKMLALHLLTMPAGSMGDHSEVSMLISQNYCHSPEQEKHIVCFLPGNFPASECYMPTFQNTVCSIFIGAYKDGTDSVLKCRRIKFRCRGITQKKAYTIQNMAKEKRKLPKKPKKFN